MSIWRWHNWLPPVEPGSRVSLGEGNTPLVQSQYFSRVLKMPNLYLKIETSNPTGSYKDRFAAAAVSGMIDEGKVHCFCTSSGNTGAALAAYCARGSLSCKIVAVEGAPAGKLRQMRAYGASICRISGFGYDPDITEQVMSELLRKGHEKDVSVQISAFCFSPLGMMGVQTIAYELAEVAEFDHVFVPAGGGGLCLAIGRGFQAACAGKPRSPKIECVQPIGNDTIASALRTGKPHARRVKGSTRISGLQVPNVLDGDEVVQVCQRSGGTGHLVTDEEVWEVQRLLAQEEGIFCEPAGAVALAGLMRGRRDETIDGSASAVCVVTGSGFKDEVSLARMTASDLEPPMSIDTFKNFV